MLLMMVMVLIITRSECVEKMRQLKSSTRAYYRSRQYSYTAAGYDMI